MPDLVDHFEYYSEGHAVIETEHAIFILSPEQTAIEGLERQVTFRALKANGKRFLGHGNRIDFTERIIDSDPSSTEPISAILPDNSNWVRLVLKSAIYDATFTSMNG